MTFTPGGGSTITGGANRNLLAGIVSRFRDWIAGGPQTVPDPSPNGPTLASISPTTSATGTGVKTITITGTKLVAGLHSQAKIAGAARPLTVVNGTTATFTYDTTGASAGAKTVSVDGVGGTATFTVT